MKKLFLISILSVIYLFSQATDYYVSPAGNDTKDGKSIANAWKTPGKVNDFAWSPGFVAGDRILFEGGKTFTITSGVYIQSDKTKGTAASPITFSSYGTGRATIKAKGCHAFQVWAPSTGTVGLGLKFTNLNIEGDSVALSGPKSACGFSLWNSSSSNLDYLLIEDVTIRGFAGDGFATGRDAGKGRFTKVTLRRVVAHNNPGGSGVSPHSGSGIIVAGADGALVEHCMAYKNGKNNNNAGGPIGIWFWDAINSTIQYCESYDNETTSGDGGGFDLDGGCQNCIIQYCYSHNNAGAGYLFAQFSGASTYGPLKNNIIRYNISQNDGRKGSFGGISFWGNDATNKVDINYIYNNTVYQGGTASSGTPSCVYFLGGNCSGVKMWNNIFIAASNYHLINSTAVMDTTKVHFQNNDYWVVSGTTFKIKWGATTYNALDTWQAAVVGQEKINNTTNVGLFIDPQLNNAGNGGTIGNTALLSTLTAYKLKTTSGLIGKGLDLTKAPYNKVVGTRDFYGNTIPQGTTFDIGAHDTLSSTPSPVLSVTPASLAFGNVTTNTTSTEKTYTLTGSNLTTNVTVTAPTGYEVSKTTGAGFAASVTVTPTSGSVNQVIYVRFKPTAVQAYNGNVSNASTGATTINVALTGSGIAPTPVLSTTPTTLAFGNVITGATSTELSYTITGSNLTANVTVTAPTGYEVSKTTGAGFAASVTVTPTSGSVNQVIYVRFKPTAVQAYNGNVSNASTGATTINVALTGSGIAPTPVLSATPTTLAFGNVITGSTSTEKTYTLTGSNLTANVTVTAPTGYEVSKTTGAGFAASVTVTPTSGSVNQMIYVRFKPTAVQAYNGNVTNASTGATTQNVVLTGAGIAATYTITFKVVDTKNAAISGASVTFNSQTLTTNTSGQAVFSNVSLGSKTYIVTKTGYITVNSSVNVAGSSTVNVTLSKQKHALTVTNGTGTGTYEEGAVVTISANTLLKSSAFKKWTGNTAILADSLSATTTAIIGSSDATITAVYETVTNSIDAKVFTAEVYPNPCSEYVNVRVSGREGVMISIYDMLGRKVNEQKAGIDLTTISVAGLNRGMYVVKINFGGDAIIRNIVIE